MVIRNAKQTIHDHVIGWADVSAAPHRIGPRGTAWFVNDTEIGHIHGNTMVDIALPREVRNEVVAGGGAEPHPIYLQLGVSIRLETPQEVERAIQLLRLC